jgi:hypothetical protein
MSINPLLTLLVLFACAVLISAADLYKVLDCVYHIVPLMETECSTYLACLNSGQVCLGT